MITNRWPSIATQAQQTTAIFMLPSHANKPHQQDSHHSKNHRQTACLAKEKAKTGRRTHHNKSEVKQEWTSQTQSLTIMWSQRSGQPSTNERSQALIRNVRPPPEKRSSGMFYCKQVINDLNRTNALQQYKTPKYVDFCPYYSFLPSLLPSRIKIPTATPMRAK